jgi:ATP-dependent helicase/nuclease subunit B
MAFGLEPPERRTGQIAHDFQMASGMPNVIYTRALRAGNAPSVSSRFLQRLIAILGPDIANKMRDRGAIYCGWAGMIDDAERQKPAERPEPKPDSTLIPTRYSFSEAGRLRRDPYAVYARRILKLDPIDPFNTDPGVAERGTLYHAILDRFVRENIDPAAPAAWDVMSAIMNEEFGKANLPPHISATWRPRFEETAKAYLKWDSRRVAEIDTSKTEARARMDLGGGFELTGFADRIDIKTSGLADIIDYKTGSTPSLSQARALLDPQLSLEAAALQAGAFENLGRQEAGDLLYVRLRPGDKFKAEKVNGDPETSKSKTPPKTTTELAADSTRELVKLLTLLKTGKRGFLSRVIPERAEMDGDYDHLARTAEWSTNDSSDEGGDIG